MSNSICQRFSSATLGSIDVVMNVFDDPTWRFDWFGDQGGMGGVETGGIRRAVNAFVTYSEVIDGKIVTKENYYVEVP